MVRRYSESNKCLITCIIISLASHLMDLDLRQNIQYISVRITMMVKLPDIVTI